jgi:hypothetical protein
MGLFDSLVELATDTVKIVAAPIDVAVTVVAAAVKPVAELVEELADDIKDALK